MAIFLNTNVTIKFFAKIAVVWAKKTPIFLLNFSAKIFKNHYIGPWFSVDIRAH
jgi:hypothetical protein